MAKGSMARGRAPAPTAPDEHLGQEQLSGPNTLLRLLRSPNDPPQPGGLSKIELATQVWARSTPQLPGKAEILKEWILSSWDQKGLAPSTVVQTPYLDLLHTLLSHSPTSLPPRYLSQYFDAVTVKPDTGRGHSVWIVGMQACEASSDIWIHTYIRMLRCLAQSAVYMDPELVSLVEQKVFAAISMTHASKKSSASAMVNLPDIAPAFLQHPLLRDDVLGAVLWPLPVLKVSKDISSILSALPQTSDMLSFLPRLLRSYTTVVQTHQRELFVQPTSSRSSYGTYLQDRTRSTLNTAVREIKAALRLIEGNEVSLSEPGWSCRERIWQAIAQSGLYLEVDPSWTSLLAEDTQAASVVLRGQPAIGLVRSVMLFLTSAEKLDHVATAVTPSSLAWCLAAPTELYPEAQGLLLATLRYHLLSNTAEAWFSTVINALGALVDEATTNDVAQSIRQLVVRGPLFGDQLQRNMSLVRQKDSVVQMMTSRIRAIASLTPPAGVILDVLSRCCVHIFPISTEASADILSAFENALSTHPSSSTQTLPRDTTYELCLAATIRIGRHGDVDSRTRFNERHDLQRIVQSAQSEDLRVESFLWLSVRLCDLKDSDRLLTLMSSALGGPSADALWRHVDVDTLVVLNSLASEAQLAAICQTLLQRPMLAQHMCNADAVELPRVANALSQCMVDTISTGKGINNVFAIMPFLPASLFRSESRQKVVRAATIADATGSTPSKETIRHCLERFVHGSSTHLDAYYWTLLEADIEQDYLRTCSETLLKTAIRSALSSSDETTRLLELSNRDSTRTLFAEVAVEHDFARLPRAVCELLNKLEQKLSDGSTTSMTMRMRLALLKLRRWCRPSADVTDLLLERGSMSGGVSTSDQLELLRLGCRGSEDEQQVLQLLLHPKQPYDIDTLRGETTALGLQSVDFALLVQSCLVDLVSSTTRGLDTFAGFNVLSALLGVRRQGSGKVILQCREALVTLLTDHSATPPRMGAIKALVRYRANVLRVTDVARIIDCLGASPNAAAVEIVHAMVVARSDLVVHILSTLVRFICETVRHVQEDTAVSLGRLLSSITRSRKATPRDISLGGPFSKHAPMILVDYVRCLARMTVSPAARRVLQNSMFKICDAVVRLHDRGREGEGMGMPYGLGEAGEAEKELWAEMWRQWSRSRYKGLG